jgi:hypothetical protein
MKFATSAITAVLGFAVSSVHGEEEHSSLSWGELAVRLPKPLSDHSASLNPNADLIYIAGGCGKYQTKSWAICDVLAVCLCVCGVFASRPHTMTFI